MHHYESECHAKRLICYFQGQGHCKSSYDQNMTITTVAFMWVPEHVGIWGNEAADRVAKEALEKEPIDDLMPFSDLKPLTAKYIHQVWQKEWDEAIVVSTKLHDIFPKLSDQLLTFCNTRKEDTVLN